MKTQLMYLALLGTCLAGSDLSGSSHYREEEVKTDAGRIHLPNTHAIKHSGVYHQVKHVDTNDRVIDLDNGSRWTVSNSDIVKGWGNTKNIVITQNHSGLSTSRYALLNLDLKQAEPISLVREPTPGKDNLYVKSVDRVNDVITLSDGKNWIAHSGDHSKLGKISENDRVIVGVNTGSDKDRSPYLIIDTANHQFIRSHMIE
jgi:hypothetical protein